MGGSRFIRQSNVCPDSAAAAAEMAQEKDKLSHALWYMEISSLILVFRKSLKLKDRRHSLYPRLAGGISVYAWIIMVE
ncbi:hypothetical protein BDV37DRAFT_237905 [Aspergillus pseudonomiae]|uniref:Uncharacterized protein n=1 Tax=Aspergillus pseudonomiae TaxID=1506151 RepID=A0A5N7DU51_9EURO|nr:uncharacterized protein BDV37DRAFT_237905 [Aspergillus pseudonomiae]KAE8409048.1 hypothetical protein BDV37DRAFT_237905 [Aspergillus pseudonomiae]